MRVIAGTAKGHHLKVPKGTPTRPTTDLVRGAIFDIIAAGHLAAGRGRVLDLFSGSGALGIEALSRGATFVDFVDREPKCCAIIKENLAHTGLAAQAKVHCIEVNRALSQMDTDYHLVLIDPPYADQTIGAVIDRLGRLPAVSDETTVVVTHFSRYALEPAYAELSMFKERRHGDSVISFFRKETHA